MPYLLTSAMFNCFGLKLIFDNGLDHTLDSFLFFHFLISALFGILINYSHGIGRALLTSTTLSLTAYPVFTFLVFNNQLSITHLVLYQLFVSAVQLIVIGFSNRFLIKSPWQLLFGLVFMIFLWGIPIIIEAIPFFYDVIAPLTIAYHYSLISTGIMHISTLLYLGLLIGILNIRN